MRDGEICDQTGSGRISSANGDMAAVGSSIMLVTFDRSCHTSPNDPASVLWLKGGLDRASISCKAHAFSYLGQLIQGHVF